MDVMVKTSSSNRIQSPACIAGVSVANETEGVMAFKPFVMEAVAVEASVIEFVVTVTAPTPGKLCNPNLTSLGQP